MCAKGEETAGLPWDALPRGLLHVDEVGEDAELGGGAGDHDDEPEVELGFGPVVFAPAFGDAHDLGRHVEGGGDGRDGGGRASRMGRPYMSLRRKERCPDPGRWVVEKSFDDALGRSLLLVEGAPVLDVSRLWRCNCTQDAASVSTQPSLLFRDS